MTNDTAHTYTFDAEGNITAVDGGGTATYVYNALNQRVRTVTSSAATEYVFNAAGQRVSEWNGTTRVQAQGQVLLGRQAGSLLHHRGQRIGRRALRAPGLDGDGAAAHHV